MRTITKSLIPIYIVFTLVLGCAKTPDPVINKQLNTIQLLQRLNELQNTVIELYSTNSVTPQHALVYTKFIVSATKTVKELPAGWQSTVKASWQEVKTLIPLDQMELKIQFTAKLIDGLVGAL